MRQKGGYTLVKNQAEISVGNIIRMIDGLLASVPCVSHSYYKRCEECVDETTCEIRHLMRRIRDATSDILDTTYLSHFEKVDAL